LVSSVADVRVLSHVNYSDHLPILLQLGEGPTSGPAPRQSRQYDSKPIRELSARARGSINSELMNQLEGVVRMSVGIFWGALKNAIGPSPPQSGSNRPERKKDPRAQRAPEDTPLADCPHGEWIRRNSKWVGIRATRTLPMCRSSRNDAYNFFREVYADTALPDKREWKGYLSETTGPSVTFEVAKVMSAPISVGEVMKAVGSLGKGMAPGQDGLTHELYQALDPVNLGRLTDAFNEFFLGGGVGN
jgi:hypothetical protein